VPLPAARLQRWALLLRLVARSLTDCSMWGLLRDGPIAVSCGLYAMLGFVALTSNELWPLYVLNDRAHGGFGWSSAEIGLVVVYAGPLLMAFQAFVYGPLVARIGLVRLTRWNLLLFAVTQATTPMCSLSLLASPWVQHVVLSCHFAFTTVVRVAAFTSVFVFVANCAEPSVRGRANGLGQAMVSVLRAVGPPIGTALFALSVSEPATAFGWPLNYYATWYLMTALALATLALTYWLPPWIERKRVPGEDA
jgi:MFS family permease